VVVPNQENYPMGFGYDWAKTSDALLLEGIVVDCGLNPGALLGAQLSLVGLAGDERFVLPGYFSSPTFDRSGTLLAAAHRESNSSPGFVVIHNLAGELVLEVGEGEQPKYQP
jgi:hypothetical protein